MTDETKRAIQTIGQWLLDSVSASDLDRLMDRVHSDRLESDAKCEIAAALTAALGCSAE